MNNFFLKLYNSNGDEIGCILSKFGIDGKNLEKTPAIQKFLSRLAENDNEISDVEKGYVIQELKNQKSIEDCLKMELEKIYPKGCIFYLSENDTSILALKEDYQK